MKKIISLLMFLCLSSLSFSQVTNTKSTSNCYSDAQVTEIFKGLKQGEYLENRLSVTEKTLTEAQSIIAKQAEIGIKKDTIIDKQKSIILLKDMQYQELTSLMNNESNRLSLMIEQEKTNTKKQSRKKLWSGLGYGTGVGVVGTIVALLLIK